VSGLGGGGKNSGKRTENQSRLLSAEQKGAKETSRRFFVKRPATRWIIKSEEGLGRWCKSDR